MEDKQALEWLKAKLESLIKEKQDVQNKRRELLDKKEESFKKHVEALTALESFLKSFTPVGNAPKLIPQLLELTEKVKAAASEYLVAEQEVETNSKQLKLIVDTIESLNHLKPFLEENIANQMPSLDDYTDADLVLFVAVYFFLMQKNEDCFYVGQVIRAMNDDVFRSSDWDRERVVCALVVGLEQENNWFSRDTENSLDTWVVTSFGAKQYDLRLGVLERLFKK